MSNIRYKNEMMKRKFLEMRREAKGNSEKTIKKIESALWWWDEFTKHADYKFIKKDMVSSFKRWLSTKKKAKSKDTLSLTTQYHMLRNLNEFFLWLSHQQAYKSSVQHDIVAYFRLSNADTRIALSPSLPAYPTLEYVIKLCSFEVKNEIDRRDRALIAFTAVSAMRDLAIVSLPLGCFNIQTLLVNQDSKAGVKTKFSKKIYTTLFEFCPVLISYVTEWYNYLRKERLFDDTRPFFPATETDLESEFIHSFIAKGVSNQFWSHAGSMRKIFKERAIKAGLEYYSPHKFRHFAINEANKYASTPEQMKAISQNVGHEKLSTTFYSYAGLDPYRVANIIKDMDFPNGGE